MKDEMRGDVRGGGDYGGVEDGEEVEVSGLGEEQDGANF